MTPHRRLLFGSRTRRALLALTACSLILAASPRAARTQSPSATQPQAEAATTNSTAPQQLIPFECVGTYGEAIKGAELHGRYAFVNQGFTLRVLDLADPAHPKEIAWQRFDHEIYGIAINWPAIYLSFSQSQGDCLILDVSAPAHPRRAGTFPGGGHTVEFHLMGHFLVTETWRRINCQYLLYDVRQPLKPVPKKSQASWQADDLLATDGERLFTVERTKDSSGTLHARIKDATTSDSLLGELLLPLEQYEDDFKAFDLSVEDGQLVASFAETSASLPLVGIKPEATIWTYSKHGEVYIEQQGRPAQPERLSLITEGGDLQIMENAKDSSPTLRAVYGAHAGARQFKMVDKRGYLIDGEGGLQILDMSNPIRPRLLARHTPGGKPVIRAIEDDLVFLGDEEAPGFLVLDGSKLDALALRGRYTGPAESMSIQGNLAYVAADKEGLQILDISNPADIHAVGHFKTAQPATDLATSGTLVYLLAGNVSILNAADPAKPALLSQTTVTLKQAWGEGDEMAPNVLKKLGSTLFLLALDEPSLQRTGSAGRAFDVSDPARPKLLPYTLSAAPPFGEDAKTQPSADAALALVLNAAERAASPYGGWFLGLPSGYQHARSWDEIYGHRLTLIDLADPRHPIEVGQYDALQSSERAALYKNNLYWADNDGGLVILRPARAAQPKPAQANKSTQPVVKDVVKGVKQ